MSRVDTTSFANLLMGGLRAGINLGESANQQAFQQQQFNANEQQRGFANSLALEGRDMQRMQIIQQAEERVAKREELENKRKATTELMRLAGDPNAQYNPSDPRFAKWLEAVDRETQDHFYSAGNNRDRLNRRKALADSRKASGYKFSLREANDYEKDGIFIEDQYLLPTAKNERQQQDENDKNGYLALMVDRFGLPQETAQKWLGKSAKFVSDRYNELKTAAEAVAKQQAEQQAAAQKQQLADTNYQNARTAGVKAGVNPAQLDARIAADRAGFTLGENAFGGESDSAARAGLNQRIQAAKATYELALKELEPLAAAVKADPVTGEASGSITGKGFWNRQSESDAAMLQKYEAVKAKADQARRTYEALNQQAIGGGAIQADPIQKKRERAMQLKSQGVPIEQARAILLQEFGE